MDTLQDNPFCMTICAPRLSGKSFFVKTMLRNGLMDRFKYVYIMCPSINLNQDYDEFRDDPRVTFIAEPNPNTINGAFTRLSELKEEEVDAIRKDKAKIPICPEVLFIFDDCIDSGVFKFKGDVDKIAERGRHIKLSCIICSQRISAVSRSIRINSDAFIIFCPYSASELEQFMERFVFRNQRKELMKRCVDIFEQDYQFIVVNNREKSMTDKIWTSNADDYVKDIMEVVHVHEKNPKNL